MKPAAATIDRAESEAPLRRLSGLAEGAAQRIRALRHLAPLSFVALPVLFNLWVLRAETTVVQNFNDSVVHFSMLRWARDQIAQGKVPLDGWYPYLGLGAAQFHRYQSFPHIIAAYISMVFGAPTTYFWSLYLLLALWPISVYIGARLFGWDRWTAGLAALVSPLLWSVTSYGYEDSSYMWWGLGMWSQLWGMWLLPLAWGLGWRAVGGSGSYALAAAAIALTMVCHFLTGYLAVLALGVWVLADPPQLLRRALRSALVGAGAFLIAAWAIVPLILDARWYPVSEFSLGTFWLDSYGAPKVLGWLVTGQIYDSGRLPVVTALVAVGLIACVWQFRRDGRARAVLGVWVLSLLLFFGRPTLGPLLNLIPGSQNLFLHRYIMGVHLAGLILAGVGGVSLARLLIRGSQRILPAVRPAVVAIVLAGLGIAALFPAWSAIAAYDGAGSDLKTAQLAQEQSDGADLQLLIDRIKSLGGGRAYAGSLWTWGKNYAIGNAPLYAVLTNSDVDGIGFVERVASMMNDDEVRFDDRNAAQYDLFNVRFLILPVDQAPLVNATLLARAGRHALWSVNTSGYLEVVDTVGPAIVADRTNLGRQTAAFLESQQLVHKQYSFVAYEGASAPESTLPSGVASDSPPGTVLYQTGSPADGVFSGEIIANRVAVVLLKASYHPRWEVTLDGVRVQPEMVAPALVARTVSPGRHSVIFRYVPYPYYPELLLLGVIALLSLLLGPRWLGPGRAPVWVHVARSRWVRWPSTNRVRDSLPNAAALVEAVRAPARVGRRLLRNHRWEWLEVRASVTTHPLAAARSWAWFVAAATGAAGIVIVTQIRDRGPLAWDEAVRVGAGWSFAHFVAIGDLAGAWHWVNDQVFYPFLAPAIHGILLLFGASQLVAAWLPSVVAYAAAGVLVARLARDVGAGRVGMWVGALLFWLTPLEVRLAAGAFTEPLGALAYTALLILLIKVGREPRARTALLISVLVAAITWLKWDYGLIALAVLALTGIVAPGENPRSLRTYQLSLVGAWALIGASLIFNLRGKLDGFAAFLLQAGPAGGQSPDFTFYPKALFLSPDFALSPLTALVLLLGAVASVAMWRRRSEVRPVVLLVGLGYVVYSVATIRQARYLAPTLAPLAALAAVTFEEGSRAVWIRIRGRFPRVLAFGVAGAVGVIMVAPQVPALAVPFDVLAPDPAAVQASNLFVADIPQGDQPVLLVGPTNELSPAALQLDWELQMQAPAPAIETLPWVAPADRQATFLKTLQTLKPAVIVGVRVYPGSRLDTSDYRRFWLSQADYMAVAAAQASAGCLTTVDQEWLDNHRVFVAVWRLAGFGAQSGGIGCVSQ